MLHSEAFFENGRFLHPLNGSNRLKVYTQKTPNFALKSDIHQTQW